MPTFDYPIFENERSPIEVIELNGKVDSDLDWASSLIQGREVQERGGRVLWHLNLGLFSSLPYPLSNQTQLLTLSLSIDQFCEKIWTVSQGYSLGLCLYEGSLDFSQNFLWDQEQEENLQDWVSTYFRDCKLLQTEIQSEVISFSSLDSHFLSKTLPGNRLVKLFCRDVAADYLDLLALRVPDKIPCFCLLDGTGIQDLSLLTELSNSEKFPYVSLSIKGIHNDTGAQYAICLPDTSLKSAAAYEGLDEILIFLTKNKIPFRIIPEAHLTTKWDGLDHIFVLPNGLSTQGKRKLDGFRAAGGNVILPNLLPNMTAN